MLGWLDGTMQERHRPSKTNCSVAAQKAQGQRDNTSASTRRSRFSVLGWGLRSSHGSSSSSDYQSSGKGGTADLTGSSHDVQSVELNRTETWDTDDGNSEVTAPVLPGAAGDQDDVKSLGSGSVHSELSMDDPLLIRVKPGRDRTDEPPHLSISEQAFLRVFTPPEFVYISKENCFPLEI